PHRDRAASRLEPLRGGGRARPVPGALRASARHPRRSDPRGTGARARSSQGPHPRAGADRRQVMTARTRTAVVIGGGISGLATAALLARDGYQVDLVEARDVLGGRAGSWEQGGFRFDTGPSWYLMPEVFDHFFRLLGTSAAEQLDLRQLGPGYRVLFEGHEEGLDVSASAARNADAFERIEPGAGLQLAKHLDSAARTYDVALERFLYSSFTSLRPFLSPRLALQAPRLLQL